MNLPTRVRNCKQIKHRVHFVGRVNNQIDEAPVTAKFDGAKYLLRG
jgi:hypothetical protein